MKSDKTIYITPNGNRYDREQIIEEVIAESNFQAIKPEDKEFFQKLHDTYWALQNNS